MDTVDHCPYWGSKSLVMVCLQSKFAELQQLFHDFHVAYFKENLKGLRNGVMITSNTGDQDLSQKYNFHEVLVRKRVC